MINKTNPSKPGKRLQNKEKLLKSLLLLLIAGPVILLPVLSVFSKPSIIYADNFAAASAGSSENIYINNTNGNNYADIIAESDEYINISAVAAIIYEAESGRILWQKNSLEKMFPASTTKMMTAIVAIERIQDLDEIIRIPANASGRNDSFYPFKTGQEITLRDLLKAALISSHNNATIALAEHISGSEAGFLKLMNAKAIEIGAVNTFFLNTNGLDSKSPEHKTTAYDLALIASYCMENELFREIVGTKEDVITLGDEKLTIYNTNSLLFFDYVKGIKTGFTNNAGYCLVIFSERQDLKLITVVLNCAENSREADMLRLINWSNDNFFTKKIQESGKSYKTIVIQDIQAGENYTLSTTHFTDLYTKGDYEKLVNKDDVITISDNLKEFNTDSKNNIIYIPETPVFLPAENGAVAGYTDIYINNDKISTSDLIIGESIDKTYISIELTAEFNKNSRNILIALISFYFLIFIFIIIKNFIEKKRESPY